MINWGKQPDAITKKYLNFCKGLTTEKTEALIKLLDSVYDKAIKSNINIIKKRIIKLKKNDNNYESRLLISELTTIVELLMGGELKKWANLDFKFKTVLM